MDGCGIDLHHSAWRAFGGNHLLLGMSEGICERAGGDRGEKASRNMVRAGDEVCIRRDYPGGVRAWNLLWRNRIEQEMQYPAADCP